MSPVQDFIEANRATLGTPYYLIDEARMVEKLEKIGHLRSRTGVKSVLALKCFSTWSVFDLMRPFLDGTTASSVYEARLGYEKFGKEVHAYSVAFSEEDIRAVQPLATKIIFNSISQLERFHAAVRGTPLGLRVNPGISCSGYDLADPARENSRLGATRIDEIEGVSDRISGLMFHCNCENADFAKFSAMLDHIGRTCGTLLAKMEWVSLGGGISFTKADYPFDAFCELLAGFSQRFKVQVYLEPGEAVVTRSGFLVTSVLDVVHNGAEVAIVDAGVEPHMLDLLVYRMTARVELPRSNGHEMIVAGRTCLAGDVFSTYAFPEKLAVGSLIAFEDAAGYTMVKKNWFNGIPMPSIVVRRRDGRVEVIKEFGYEDFVTSLS
jgi:carboxynorspermidine decarboxylase